MTFPRLTVLAAAIAATTACPPPPSDGGPVDAQGDTGEPDGGNTPMLDGGDRADGGTPDGGTDAGTDAGSPPTVSDLLRDRLAMLDPPLEPLQPIAPLPAPLVALGEALFFDPVLSGNKDTACASCHHPALATSDGLSLAVGTGATGLGPARAEPGYPGFTKRHSPQLFNLGQPGFDHLFWDARVELDGGVISTPAGDDPLPGLSGALAAQALFPLLDRLEMRGQAGDLAVTGEANELALIADDDPQSVWAAILARLLAIEGYQTLFASAYPDVAEADLTLAHATNAIAAYISTAFEATASPWDAYLAGDDDAINEAAKLGALLFYGSAGCAACHTGPLLTDHKSHNIGAVQIGPGHPDSAPFDIGRAALTGVDADRFTFRTPSLRNVALTAPYMHNGAYEDLQAILRHYGNPLNTVATYDSSWLHPDLIDTVQTDAAHVADMTSHLSDELVTTPQLAGLSNIRLFLESLTDPSAESLVDAVPEQTVSGLTLE